MKKKGILSKDSFGFNLVKKVGLVHRLVFRQLINDAGYVIPGSVLLNLETQRMMGEEKPLDGKKEPSTLTLTLT